MVNQTNRQTTHENFVLKCLRLGCLIWFQIARYAYSSEALLILFNRKYDASKRKENLSSIWWFVSDFYFSAHPLLCVRSAECVPHAWSASECWFCVSSFVLSGENNNDWEESRNHSNGFGRIIGIGNKSRRLNVIADSRLIIFLFIRWPDGIAQTFKTKTNYHFWFSLKSSFPLMRHQYSDWIALPCTHLRRQIFFHGISYCPSLLRLELEIGGKLINHWMESFRNRRVEESFMWCSQHVNIVQAVAPLIFFIRCSNVLGDFFHGRLFLFCLSRHCIGAVQT